MGKTALVTGVAGFVGSSLAEDLLRRNWRVRGVDSLSPYYSVEQKQRNLGGLLESVDFHFLQQSLVDCDVGALLEGVDTVFHLAGQPGVRQSWSTGFAEYVENNVLATQRLLEAVRSASVERVVYASSSSVYGQRSGGEAVEGDLVRPSSPYGVTKLAGENLCGAYASNFGVPTVALRYFTVYGPRQRPDMAISRILRAAYLSEEFTIFGDGQQLRDFTYVSDVVRASVAAAEADVSPGSVVNVAGGASVSLATVIELVRRTTGREIRVAHQADAAGDVRETRASVELARQLLGWEPQVDLAQGIAVQAAWFESTLPETAT